MQQPAAVIVHWEWILEHAVVHVAIWADRGTGACLLGHGGIEAGCRVGEAHPVNDLQCAAVERDQVTEPEIKSPGRDVNDAAVARKGRSATGGYFRDKGIIPADALCRNPGARAVTGDAGQPASESNRRDTDNRKAEVEVALSIGGQGSIDFHCLSIYLGGRKEILEPIKIEVADLALRLVWARTH